MRREFIWNRKNIINVCFGILICIAINLAGRNISEIGNLPFWFDSIGTVIIAAYIGPVPGAIVGGITNLCIYLMGQDNLPYAIVNIAVAIVVGKMYPEDLKDYFQIVCTAALTAIVAIVLSTPLNIFLYHGYCGNLWGDALFDMLQKGGSSFLGSAILGEAFVDFPDKVLTLVLASICIRGKKWIYNMKGEKNEAVQEVTGDN